MEMIHATMSFTSSTHILVLNTTKLLNHFLLHLAFLAESALLKLWLNISKSIQIRKKKRRTINVLCRWRFSLRLFLVE